VSGCSSWPATPLWRVRAPPARATAKECELLRSEPPQSRDRLVSPWPSPCSGGPVRRLRGRPQASVQARGLSPAGSAGRRQRRSEGGRRRRRGDAKRCGDEEMGEGHAVARTSSSFVRSAAATPPSVRTSPPAQALPPVWAPPWEGGRRYGASSPSVRGPAAAPFRAERAGPAH